MSTELRTAFMIALSQARGADAAAWKSLERAHILSQAHPWPHTFVHWRMFVFALRTRNFREALGQVVRMLFAAPGSFLGRAPVGNTGGANVGIFQPMNVPADLRIILLTDERSARMIGNGNQKQL